MPPPPSYPPRSLCLLRLSSIGDVAHMLPVVHTLRHCWPDTRLTWVVGETEAALVAPLPDVEFVVFRKRRGWRAHRQLAAALRGREFDGLFLMQVSVRAGAASLAVRAPVRMGFDRARAREGHGLFVNHRIAAQTRPHVVDGFLGFLAAAGIDPQRFRYRFDIPEDAPARAFAQRHLPDAGRAVLLSPCAGNPERNWRIDRYAQVADLLIERHGLAVVLTCAPEPEQVQFVDRVCARMRHAPKNLAGQTSLQQTLSLMRRARFVLAPDSGPAHLGTVAGVPVLGLYAVSPSGRTGPYRSLDYCVDSYDQAARRLLGRPAAALPWGRKLHSREAMGLITVEQVMAAAQRLLDAPPPAAPDPDPEVGRMDRT